jgi:hypothetical protein
MTDDAPLSLFKAKSEDLLFIDAQYRKGGHLSIHIDSRYMCADL